MYPIFGKMWFRTMLIVYQREINFGYMEPGARTNLEDQHFVSILKKDPFFDAILILIGLFLIRQYKSGYFFLLIIILNMSSKGKGKASRGKALSSGKSSRSQKAGL